MNMCVWDRERLVDLKAMEHDLEQLAEGIGIRSGMENDEL